MLKVLSYWIINMISFDYSFDLCIWNTLRKTIKYLLSTGLACIISHVIMCLWLQACVKSFFPLFTLPLYSWENARWTYGLNDFIILSWSRTLREFLKSRYLKPCNCGDVWFKILKRFKCLNLYMHNNDDMIIILLYLISLQGPLFKWISGSWTYTPVIEYYDILPYATIMSSWYSRYNWHCSSSYSFFSYF